MIKVIVFKASWCHKCHQLEPFLKEIKDIQIIDVDVCQDYILDDYKVDELPHIVLEKENGEKLKYTGEFKDLKEWVNGIKRTNA